MSNSAKLSARERIESLVDANSFVEIGGMITKRNTDFNMQEKAVPADGVITGYGVVNSNLVYIYSQDVTALNGSVGEMHAKKIAGIYEMAMKAGAPVIGLIDSSSPSRCGPPPGCFRTAALTPDGASRRCYAQWQNIKRM